MKPQLQRIEIEPAVFDNDDFAVEDTAARQLRPRGSSSSGKYRFSGFSSRL